MDRKYLELYAITDRRWLKEGELLKDRVEEAILGGATMIQYREKELKGEELKREAESVKEVCSRYQIPFIVNDDVNLALEIDSDGVHVGQSDMDVKKAREILGKEKIIGATAKTVEQAAAAYEAGADYLGSGAVFGSSTKKDARYMSPDLLKEIASSVPIPVAAIGGIDETNAGELKGLPVAGAAVIKGVFGKANVRSGAADVKAALFGRPVVQCITNHVTVNDVANVVLSMGASPIMSHHIKEVSEVQGSATALLLNLGATDDYEAMKEAMKTALSLDHPVVIDPVGVGVSSYRRDFFNDLISVGSPACIRGNYSEILALSNDQSTLRGLDDDNREDDVKTRMKVVSGYAKKCGTVVAASGPVDIISDGSRTLCIEAGHPMQRRITGSGCMLSASIAAVYAISPANRTELAAGVCKYLGNAAGKAAASALSQGGGSMSFKLGFMDQI